MYKTRIRDMYLVLMWYNKNIEKFPTKRFSLCTYQTRKGAHYLWLV